MKYPQTIELLSQTECLDIMYKPESLANIGRAPTVLHIWTKHSTSNILLSLETKMNLLSCEHQAWAAARGERQRIDTWGQN